MQTRSGESIGMGCMIHGRFGGDCGSGGFGSAFRGIRREGRRSDGECCFPSIRKSGGSRQCGTVLWLAERGAEG